MTEITDEVVERALAAYRKSIVSPDHPTAADIMRSIIHAVAPQIAAQERERAANMVEFPPMSVREMAVFPFFHRWLQECAAAIRQEPGHE